MQFQVKKGIEKVTKFYRISGMDVRYKSSMLTVQLAFSLQFLLCQSHLYLLLHSI